MKEAPYQVILDAQDDNFNLKEFLLRYVRYWYWFVLGVLICGVLAFVYLRYAPIVFDTKAKIKILKEDEENLLTLDPSSILTGKSQINLENEIQVLKSYRLLSQVVEELDLDIDYFHAGDVKTTKVWRVPFEVKKKDELDSLSYLGKFNIRLTDNGFLISDEDEQQYVVSYDALTTEDLPFNITFIEDNWTSNYRSLDYQVALKDKHQTILNLAKNLQVQPTNKESDILSIRLSGESYQRSEAIINTLIEKFDEDGILDRQLVSQRTLDFIDDRFVYLTQELDSIETGKQSFKEANQLAYIEADAGLTLQRKAQTEAEVSKLTTQISITDMMRDAAKAQRGYGLLPANVGLDNVNLNTMVAGYNELVLEREKILPNMGNRNPTLIAINEQLARRLVNINKSLNIYGSQLRTALKNLRQDGAINTSRYSALPEKERALRAIERQQNLKENLFLVLLEKREEAAINYAITTPSIKVIDYALTSRIPASPKNMMIYGIAGLSGLLLPFLLLYIRFSLDTKIHSKKDIERTLADLPLLAEIPTIPEEKLNGILLDRSGLGESFRILATNLNFLTRQKASSAGKIVLCTSSVKGEGKTLLSLQLALAYMHMGKKVLLIGADLRNPQLHTHFKLDKNRKGLSDLLLEGNANIQGHVEVPNPKEPDLHILFSGRIPPNAPQLLSGTTFAQILENAREQYDVILVDTAPTVLVTDTLLISELADVTLYAIRSEFSEKQLLEHIDNLHKTKKLPNIGLVLNDVGRSQGYGYKYGYNYGYGYGYSEEKKKKPWYTFG